MPGERLVLARSMTSAVEVQFNALLSLASYLKCQPVLTPPSSCFSYAAAVRLLYQEFVVFTALDSLVATKRSKHNKTKKRPVAFSHLEIFRESLISLNEFMEWNSYLKSAFVVAILI